MNNEPLPQIHLIRDTDLITFAYELHIFAGDFLRESEFNLHSLVTNTGADSIAIMGKNHMWLSDALHAYCSTADLHQMIFTTEYIGARAFLFHTYRKEDGRLYGDVMMLYEKDALKSWGFCYRPEQVTEWQHHYSDMFSQWKEQAFSYMAQDLEELLNVGYMEAAQNPDTDMYRIPLGTARQMLLYDEAPVYRLLPSGPEKIPPIAAVTTGLWYENYREFAVTPEDLGAVDSLVCRETDRLVGNRLKLHQSEKNRPTPER